ncbi:uncharacterized protein LOC143913135 [Arctopsyche grandis]|uniref:uncharacterized protein LOC143913135 n=1 Tax=Arctopsyche grandis TaxID=121162 RepID=UPI00406D8C0F
MATENFVENIISLYSERRWKDIINNFMDEKDKNKLSWIFPSESNLNFINSTLKECNLNSIISVGCGSGLLEWILKESLDISITGIEIDGCWWNCKYAPPSFIPLHLAKNPLNHDESTLKILDNDVAAIMFCYFNNRNAFVQYMKYFTGGTLIIIGPGEGRYTHTDPTPFDHRLSESWSLLKYEEVRNTKDYIAIYRRK